MKRREFLVGAAVSAATVVGLPGQGTQAPPPGGQPGGGQGRGGGRGRVPAPVPPAKLARISLMTLNFNTYLKNAEEPTSTRPDSHSLRPAEDVCGDLRHPQHRVSAHDDRPVRDRPGVHQGAEGQARREQRRHEPDQPGVRHRSSRSPTKTPQAASRPSIT